MHCTWSTQILLFLASLGLIVISSIYTLWSFEENFCHIVSKNLYALLLRNLDIESHIAIKAFLGEHLCILSKKPLRREPAFAK